MLIILTKGVFIVCKTKLNKALIKPSDTISYLAAYRTGAIRPPTFPQLTYDFFK
jgi:hypothetical protein